MPSDSVLGLLVDRLAEGADVAALAVWHAARRATGPAAADWIRDAAALADDVDRDPRLRVAALLAVALLAQRGLEVPELAIQALGDDVLVDAALEIDLAAAITGIVAAAGDRIAVADRRYLAGRLAAAGARGPHVAALHVASGDALAAATALAAGLVSVVDRDCRDRRDRRAAAAMAHLAATWAVELGRDFVDALVAALGPDARVATAIAARDAGAGDLHPLVVALGSRDR